MKKNNTTHEKVNLFFSAFLIIAYTICGYFFVGLADAQENLSMKILIKAAIFAVFGLLVFYATRVGEKKIVKRFSLVTLLILDLPCLLIILAAVIGGFPFHDLVAGAGDGAVVLMAAVALGYGLPYTFISGFETITEEELNIDDKKADGEVLEGGVEADLQNEDEENEEAVEKTEEEPEADEIVVEGVAEDDTESE